MISSIIPPPSQKIKLLNRRTHNPFLVLSTAEEMRCRCHVSRMSRDDRRSMHMHKDAAAAAAAAWMHTDFTGACYRHQTDE